MIQPLGTLVIANQGVRFWEQFGFLPDFEILSSHPEVPELHKASGWPSGSFSLRNQGDEVVLLGGADQVLDALAYGDSPFNKFQPPVAQVPEGSSYYRVFDQESGNGGVDWQEQPNPEPGKVNHPQPTSTPTPGKTPQPTLSLTPLPPVQALVISEVLVNPAGDEPGCEWIEIHNLESDTIALSGVRVGDAFHRGDREGMAVFPPGSSLPPGEVLVVAHQAACFRSVYHVLPDYELRETLAQVPALESDTGWSSGSTALSNRGDEVLLLDPWYRVLDLLVYGKTDNPAFDPPVPPPREGCSLERYPPGMDRDQAGDWREAEHPSPGRLSEIQPTLQPSPTRERTPGPEASLTLTPTHHPQPTPIPTQVPSQPAEPTLEFSPTVTLTPSSEPELTPPNTATKSGPSQTPDPSPSSTSAVITPFTNKLDSSDPDSIG